MSAKIASVLVALAMAAGCSGESTAKRLSHGEAAAGQSSEAGAGGSTNAGGSSGAGGAGSTAIAGSGSSCRYEVEPWIMLDASDCLERPLGDCTGMRCEYNYEFDGTPALSECSRHWSADGCGLLVFDFDANGCAVGVGPPPETWDVTEHLGDLRECMTRVFAGGRFACLASSMLAYHESCFIR